MNCNDCLDASPIANCYDGVTITVGWTSIISDTVVVKITHIPTKKVRVVQVTTDITGKVDISAWNMMKGGYHLEVTKDYREVTVYPTAVLTDGKCCVHWTTFDYKETSDFTLNYEDCLT